MLAFLRPKHKRLMCAALVWVALLAQWGAMGHVLQHLGVLLRAPSAPITAASFSTPQNPSEEIAIHPTCGGCLLAAQVLGASGLASTALSLDKPTLLMGLKPVSFRVLTFVHVFTAYRSQAPPLHPLM